MQVLFNGSSNGPLLQLNVVRHGIGTVDERRVFKEDTIYWSTHGVLPISFAKLRRSGNDSKVF